MKRPPSDHRVGTEPEESQNRGRRALRSLRGQFPSGSKLALSGTPTAEATEEPEADKLYGHWSCEGDPGEEGKPTALIIFSARPRKGDLRDHLTSLGWVVCCIDMAATTPANLLDDGLWSCVKRETAIALYDAIWIATPCGSFFPAEREAAGAQTTEKCGVSARTSGRPAHSVKAKATQGVQHPGGQISQMLQRPPWKRGYLGASRIQIMVKESSRFGSCPR